MIKEIKKAAAELDEDDAAEMILRRRKGSKWCNAWIDIKYGGVAQMEEQGPEKACVGVSKAPFTTNALVRFSPGQNTLVYPLSSKQVKG